MDRNPCFDPPNTLKRTKYDIRVFFYHHIPGFFRGCIFWFGHFQLEFGAETLQFCSTHGYSKSSKYEGQTPSQSWLTRRLIFDPNDGKKKHSYLYDKNTSKSLPNIFQTFARGDFQRQKRIWSGTINLNVGHLNGNATECFLLLQGWYIPSVPLACCLYREPTRIAFLRSWMSEILK